MLRNIIKSLLLFYSCTLTVSAQETTTYDNRSGLSHWIVSDILQDRQGFIWMSTWNGLNRFDGYEFRRIKVQPGDGTDIQSEVIRCMILDGNGDIICHTDNGLFKLDTKNYILKDIDRNAKYNIRKPGKSRTLRDREGNFWQVERYGVTKTSTTHHPAKIVNGTENVQARAFLLDRKQQWWLATKEDEYIRIYDRRNVMRGFLGTDGRIHKEKTPFGHRAYTLTQTRGGDIWAGCKPGALIRIRPRTDGSYDIKRIKGAGLTCDAIYHIAEDSDGRLWLATFGGGVICVPDPGTDRPSFVNITVNGGKGAGYKVRRVLPTRSGNIVCATTNGIIAGKIDRHDIRKTVLRRLARDGKQPGSLCNNATTDVVEDGNGHIIIATENSGIDMTSEEELLGKSPVFRHFNTVNSSLTSDACLAMAAKGNGHIFVVCTDKVMDFAPDSDKTVTYSRRFWNTACHFSEERPLLLPDGSWLFGQEQGAYIATPHCLNTRGYKPPLLFTELVVNGKQPMTGVCARDTIVIDTDERNFSISFAALDYTDNTGICYRSRLDNSPWSNAGSSRSLTFYDMPPGEHTLTIQSTDRYGRWIDNTRSLLIVVTPHWYETLLARVLGWIALTGMITGVIYTTFYIRNLNRQRRELLKKYMSLLDNADKRTAQKDGKKTEVLPEELPESDRRFLERVMKYIEENIGNSNANIDDMAAFAATSRSNLNRKLRSLVGITAAQLLIDARMQRAKQMLENAGDRDKPYISDIAYKCGYSDSRYFSRCFKQKYGVTPSEYHQG